MILTGSTLTIFPGATLRQALDPAWFMSTASNWALDDLVRVGSVAIISILPFFAWVRARHLRAAFAKENSYSETVGAIADDFIAGRQHVTVEKLNDAEFRKLFQDVPYAGSNLLAERLHSDVMIKAIERRIEPTALLIGPFADQLKAEVMAIAPLQRMALQLGIFFTFVGLASAFSVSQMGGFTTGRTNDIDGLLRALSLAFGTSIAGLLASMFIILFIYATRARLSATLRAYEFMTDRIYSLGRRLPTDERFLDQVGEVANEIKLTREKLEVNSVRTQELTNAQQQSWEKFVRTRADFDAMISQFAAAQVQLLQGFQNYVTALRPETLRDQMKLAVSDQLIDLNRELTATTEALRASRERVNKLESAAVTLAGLQSETGMSLSAIEKRNKEIASELRRIRNQIEGGALGAAERGFRRLWPWVSTKRKGESDDPPIG